MTFTRGSWSVETAPIVDPGTATESCMSSGTTVCDLGDSAVVTSPSGAETISVPFPVASGYVLDPSSLAAGGAGQIGSAAPALPA